VYLIFESDVYQQQLNNTEDTEDNIQNVDQPPNLDPNLDPDLDPTQALPTIEDKYQAIQKYILYQKLRELQYKLEDANFINNFKNTQDMNKYAKFLSHIIEFFNFFDYPNSLIITNHLLDEFKKLK
jgi:hypothetical protein